MIIAIHDTNVSLRGVTYEVASGVFVELDTGLLADAETQYAEYSKNKEIARLKETIKNMESETLLARPVRESLLAIAEEKAVQIALQLNTEDSPVSAADVLGNNPGYVAVKEFDSAIAELRSQLAILGE